MPNDPGRSLGEDVRALAARVEALEAERPITLEQLCRAVAMAAVQSSCLARNLSTAGSATVAAELVDRVRLFAEDGR